jgi:FAD/FMN-containing dehydrogenase
VLEQQDIAYQRYAAAATHLREDLDQAREPVRLGKRTSNLFRRRQGAGHRLAVGDFSGVLSVSPAERTADVLGMTTYEALVDATLPHGLMPAVVPQLRTITLGGAVAGLGIESSSFRNGMPHESVLEMDILTGDGHVVTARPDNEHADLFSAFPNSYGSLGYALRLRIELEQVRPYVALRHVRFDAADACFAELERVCADRSFEGEQVDFVDGVAFAPDELYLTLGTFAEVVPFTSDYTGMRIYYRSIQQRESDHLTVHDYLWRWDTDWFWCSRAFGVQRPLVRRVWPKRWLRSDVYWRLVAWEDRVGAKARIDRLRGVRHERVIQDVEIPVDRAAAFLDFLFREIQMAPVWLCPLRQRVRDAQWDLYPLDPDTLYVNFGFWGAVRLGSGEADGDRNRQVERAVADLDGRKSLYSTAFYTEEEFWRLYGGERYWTVKQRYDPQGRLLNLYDKCVQQR